MYIHIYKIIKRDRHNIMHSLFVMSQAVLHDAQCPPHKPEDYRRPLWILCTPPPVLTANVLRPLQILKDRFIARARFDGVNLLTATGNELWTAARLPISPHAVCANVL